MWSLNASPKREAPLYSYDRMDSVSIFEHSQSVMSNQSSHVPNSPKTTTSIAKIPKINEESKQAGKNQQIPRTNVSVKAQIISAGNNQGIASHTTSVMSTSKGGNNPAKPPLSKGTGNSSAANRVVTKSMAIVSQKTPGKK
jgi:hypothetical protein